MSSNFNTLNAVTGGFLNQISPTQLGRNIFNIATQDPTWSEQFVFGNNGILTDSFAEKHPIITEIIKLFRKEKGRNPNTKELQDYIDSLKDKQILNLLEHNPNSYGTEYVSNKLNAKLIKEALKYIGTVAPITIKGED